MSALQRYWPEARIAWLGRLKVRARKVGHVVTVSNRGDGHMPIFMMTLRNKTTEQQASYTDVVELDHAVTQIEAEGGTNVR